MKKTRVLLVEDHETVRQGIRALLETRPDIDVIGDAWNGRLAVERTLELKPDVVVLDVSMPEMNGLAAARAIKSAAPEVAIVALTRHGEDAYVKELLGAGASGYVLKQSAFDELVQAIRTTASGGRYLDPMLEARHGDGTTSRFPTTPARPRISDREASVLRMMALGHSNKEIATALDIALKTVEVHKANAMRKLNLRGRIDVVRYAALSGWLQDP